LVVGAGIAGLDAARILQDAGLRALVTQNIAFQMRAVTPGMHKVITETMPNISLNLKLACTLLSLLRWRYSRCREPLAHPFFKFIHKSSQ
jgi:hypothetical protein